MDQPRSSGFRCGRWEFVSVCAEWLFGDDRSIRIGGAKHRPKRKHVVGDIGASSCPEPNSDRIRCRIKALWILTSWRVDSRIVEYFGGGWRGGFGRGARCGADWHGSARRGRVGGVGHRSDMSMPMSIDMGGYFCAGGVCVLA